MSEQNTENADTLEDELEAEEDEQELDSDKAEGTANVGETSVEINVEELIAELESERDSMNSENAGTRKKLEEILEQKRVARDLEDIDDFDLGY